MRVDEAREERDVSEIDVNALIPAIPDPGSPTRGNPPAIDRQRFRS